MTRSSAINIRRLGLAVEAVCLLGLLSVAAGRTSPRGSSWGSTSTTHS